MRTVLLVLNWMCAIALVASALYFAGEGRSAAERAGIFIGISIWALAPLLTICAVRRRASAVARRVGYAANVVPIAFLLGPGLFFQPRADIGYYLLGLLIFCWPLAVNLWGLRKLRPVPLELSLVDDTPVVASVSSEVYEPTVPDVVSAATPRAEPIAPSPARPIGRPPATTPVTRGNYFARHWRGELSLPVSYWINGSGIGLLVAFGVTLITNTAEGLPLQTGAAISIGVLLLAVATTLWSLVGIWHSAVEHPARGGSQGWATTAKVMVVIGWLTFAGTLTNNILPQLNALTLIATGNDPMGRIEATISTDGRALILRGLLGEGSAEKVENLLKAAPGVETVMLESGGGRLQEAERIAAMIRARELDTYVESHCESACTYVFLAGLDRATTPNARIGFHRPTFPGIDAATEIEMLRDMQARYRRAGISPEFTAKLAVTPAEDMWYPPHKVLIANGVINRVSTGGEVASLMANSRLTTREDLEFFLRQVPLFAAYERHFPGTIEQAAGAAMRVHAGGATDAELQSAARAVFASRLPEVMAAANVEQLRIFARLSIDQLNAARAISNEACGMLLATTLDVTKVFPPELVQRELEWTMSVLAGPMRPQPPVSDVEFEATLEPLLADMPVQQLLAVGDPTAYADQPGLVCDATTNLYKAILMLPEPEQSIMLRAMFQPE